MVAGAAGAKINRARVPELAEAIADGIQNYFYMGPPPGTWIAANRKPVRYKVVRGDTLGEIANRYRVSLYSLRRANGLRGDTSIIERTKYDLWYIENWSLALDFAGAVERFEERSRSLANELADLLFRHGDAGRKISLYRDYLIPKPFDYRVLLWEAPAVAEAAIETGVATLPYPKNYPLKSVDDVFNG